MNIENIPLTKLVPSPANVRKTGGNDGIEELAASIEAHGLLQNLQVRPGPKGKFEVVAGMRRLAAASGPWRFLSAGFHFNRRRRRGTSCRDFSERTLPLR